MSRAELSPRPRTAALAAAAAFGALGCAPTVVPAAKEDVDRRLAALGAPASHFDAPAVSHGMPLEPGQWAEYRVADNLGRPSFVTHRIVGQEDDALWIETVTDSYAGKRIASVLIAVGEPRAPHRLPRRALGQEAGSNVERFAHSRRHRHFELRALVLRDDAGDVTELPPLLLKVVTFLWPYGFSLWWPEWRGEPQENVTVPAGRFAGCFRLRNADLSWNGIEAKSEAWFHPAVPLGGLVRQRSLDGSAIKDLVAFGVAGARSDP